MKTAIVVVVSYILTVAVLGYGLIHMRKSNKALTQTVAEQAAAIKSKDATVKIYKARAQSLQVQVDQMMKVQAEKNSQVEAALTKHQEWSSEKLPEDVAQTINKK